MQPSRRSLFQAVGAGAARGRDLGIDMEAAMPAHRTGDHRERQLVAEERGAEIDPFLADMLQPARRDRRLIERGTIGTIGQAVAAPAGDREASRRDRLARFGF